MAPRRAFMEKLEEVRLDVLKMGAEIEMMIGKTIQVVIQQNHELAHEIMENGKIIDVMEAEIEQKCINIISQQQPLAKDLRLIISLLKIITDLERIGDHCEDICGYSIKIHGVEWTRQEDYQRHIERMTEHVQEMFKSTLNSFMQKDATKIKEICHQDDAVDEDFKRIWKEIVEEIQAKPTFAKSGARYMMIIKYLERMADHTTNIAESLVYHLTGEFAIAYKHDQHQ